MQDSGSVLGEGGGIRGTGQTEGSDADRAGGQALEEISAGYRFHGSAPFKW